MTQGCDERQAMQRRTSDATTSDNAQRRGDNVQLTSDNDERQRATTSSNVQH
jgi:hypothetical protein